MIELNKIYKDGLGRDVRIICVDSLSHINCPVVGLVRIDGEDRLARYNETGRSFCLESASDLIIPEDFRTFAIDEPVMVRDCNESWQKENFAGVSKYGAALTWTSGTRWASNGETYPWEQCRRPTKEELES